jgi:hypothetical protein
LDENPPIIDLPSPSTGYALFEYGYIYSIELKRNEVKKQLSAYFDCDGLTEELDFLASNTDLLQILPGIGSFLFKKLENGDKMSLELLNEDKDWQTLFINVHTTLTWEETNAIFEKILDNLFELYPTLATRLNINFIPL